MNKPIKPSKWKLTQIFFFLFASAISFFGLNLVFLVNQVISGEPIFYYVYLYPKTRCVSLVILVASSFLVGGIFTFLEWLCDNYQIVKKQGEKP